MHVSGTCLCCGRALICVAWGDTTGGANACCHPGLVFPARLIFTLILHVFCHGLWSGVHVMRFPGVWAGLAWLGYSLIVYYGQC